MSSYAAAALTLGLMAQFAPLAPTSALMLGDGRTTAPVVEGKPIEVAIGFYALDFARVTSRDESFDLTGYLELSWRDSRLALSAEEKAKSNAWRRLDTARIWTPRVFFENALEQPRTHAGPVVEVDPDGVVWSWAILSAKFSTPINSRTGDRRVQATGECPPPMMKRMNESRTLQQARDTVLESSPPRSAWPVSNPVGAGG